MNLFEQITSIFGNSKKPQEEIVVKDDLVSFVVPNVDGASIVESGKMSFSYDLDYGNTSNEVELIRRYREIAKIPEVSFAIDEIINEMLSEDQEGTIFSLRMDDLEISDSTKKKIDNIFADLVKRLNINDRAYDFVRRWYVDGRIYFHKVIVDKEVKEIRYISPTTIKKQYVIEKTKNASGVEVIKTKEEYFTYQPSRKLSTISINDTTNGVNSGSITSPDYNGSSFGSIDNVIKVSPKAIAHVTSGLFDDEFNCIISHLHPALKTANNLKTLEDSMVLYRLARAPERRVFYVDIGNMPPQKGEQYMRDMMTKFKTNLTYDALTGEVKDARRNMSMLEDFWIPRRGDGKSTEISTLESGANLGEVDDIILMRKKLYMALKVPVSRIDQDAQSMSGIGRSSEISRDEVKFQKLIDRLRSKFSLLLLDILITELELKGIIGKEDLDTFNSYIIIKWAKDSFFTEMKETEILRERLTTLQLADPYLGKYFSKEYMLRKVMQMSEDEYKDMIKAIEKEGPLPSAEQDAPDSNNHTPFADTAQTPPAQ